MGREPFDEAVRRALEAQNPDVTFDWKKLASDTLPPPADVENWRERRRAEREAKRARRGDEEESAGESDEQPAGGSRTSEASVRETSADGMPADGIATVGVASGPAIKPAVVSGAADARPSGRHRRRRRGGRIRQSTNEPDVSVTPQIDTPPAQQAVTNGTTEAALAVSQPCLLYTSPSPRDS